MLEESNYLLGISNCLEYKYYYCNYNTKGIKLFLGVSNCLEYKHYYLSEMEACAGCWFLSQSKKGAQTFCFA